MALNKKIAERIEKYKSGGISESSQKKRKLSGALVLINVGMLIIILIFFRQSSEKKNLNAGISYDSLLYSFNIKKSEKEDVPLFTAAIISQAAQDRDFNFRSSIGNITLKYKDVVVYDGVIGEKIEALRLRPGETRKIILRIDRSGIDNLIEENPDAVIPKKKSNLFRQQQYVPLQALIRINTASPITLSLDFNYEID